jgi:redox-sensitive bicupin YhaK (pirin superfamily)
LIISILIKHRNLDPFLMLDEFEGSAKEGAGFPDHPHRYITVKMMLKFEFKAVIAH